MRVLPEVHEEPNYSATAHGLSVFIVFDAGNNSIQLAVLSYIFMVDDFSAC